jgi:hypothetical protein
MTGGNPMAVCVTPACMRSQDLSTNVVHSLSAKMWHSLMRDSRQTHTRHRSSQRQRSLKLWSYFSTLTSISDGTSLSKEEVQNHLARFPLRMP